MSTKIQYRRNTKHDNVRLNGRKENNNSDMQPSMRYTSARIVYYQYNMRRIEYLVT